MKFSPVKAVQVFYKPKEQKILVGNLSIKSRRIFFEYDPSFLKTKLQLSPFKLPLKPGIIPCNDTVFEQLFGVFNDSLPDGWGRLLLDRALMKYNIHPNTLSPLDRLCFVGSHGMGALAYEPEAGEAPALSQASLDEISLEIAEFQKNNNEEYVEDLLARGGSSAGARPKVLMQLKNENWLIKFPSNNDPKDIGAIEYAYHFMAKEAGLDVPKAHLFPSRYSPGFFASKRFDKEGSNRVHMHTVSGLLHADHRVPCLDYKMIMRATHSLTANIQECEKQYRQCVFNVLSHNRDDHSKNFSFLMDSSGTWKVSPGYDLTFSSGPAGEHCSMVMGEGKKPNSSHLLQLAKEGNIKEKAALEIIDQVKSSVEKWPLFAKEAGVSHSSLKFIHSTIKNL